MKRYLVDLNVVLAILAWRHDHHTRAMTWFDGLGAGRTGICRVVQLGVVRLLGNPSVLGKDAISAEEGWAVVGELLEDERLDFVEEPEGLEKALPPLLKYSGPTGKLVTDAYLSAFAIASKRQLVTFDRGFSQFRGLELEVLT
jgi:toxin-antitoxin system PIN domain toxin